KNGCFHGLIGLCTSLYIRIVQTHKRTILNLIMPLLKFTRNRDQTYGPTTNGKYYISKPDHRKNSRSGGQKTKWCIDEDQEFSVFKPACEDFNSWFCRKNNCIFAVVDNGQITLGKSGEKLAKFPNVSNGTDPWHV